MDISRQRIVITGGTRGIGLELARMLVARGAEVAVCARSEARLTELGSELPAVSTFRCDLGEPGSVRAFVHELRDGFGTPTVLVNNAGVQLNYDWTSEDPEEVARKVEQEVTIDLTSPLLLTALLLPDLLEAPEAAIVNVTSILALFPKRSAPVYCATKAGLRSFTAGLRYQLSDRPNMLVMEVVPPVVDTEMTAGRGDGKVSPGVVAAAIVHWLERGQNTVYVGKAKTVRVLNRLAPRVVAGILAKS